MAIAPVDVILNLSVPPVEMRKVSLAGKPKRQLVSPLCLMSPLISRLPVMFAAPSTSRLSHCSSPVRSTPSDLVANFLPL